MKPHLKTYMNSPNHFAHSSGEDDAPCDASQPRLRSTPSTSRRILTLVRQVLSDSKRTVGGLLLMIRYALSEDPIQVGLSLFAAESPYAHPGNVSRYRISVANVNSYDCRMRLRIEICPDNDSVRDDMRYTEFEKIVLVRARSGQELQIAYDWVDAPAFSIDGATTGPDCFKRGAYKNRGPYHVRAVHLGDRGQRHEELTLTQQLQ